MSDRLGAYERGAFYAQGYRNGLAMALSLVHKDIDVGADYIAAHIAIESCIAAVEASSGLDQIEANPVEREEGLRGRNNG